MNHISAMVVRIYCKKAMNVNDTAIDPVKDSDSRVSFLSKDDAINIMKNSDLKKVHNYYDCFFRYTYK